jgi:hypothetical protein
MVSQVTSGFKAILSFPLVYVAWQSFLQARRMHEVTCAHLQLRGGENVLLIFSKCCRR